MDFWLKMLSMMAKTLAFSLLSPFFWLVIFIVFMQYRRAVQMEKKLFGQVVNNVWEQSLYSVLFGLLGGVFGSIFLLILGISLESVGIAYLWPIAIFLLFIHPRFLCFAYAGGLVAVAALLLKGVLPFVPGWGEVSIVAGLLAIHLPSLLALVGILHLTESFLIYFSGHLGASPIYLKTSSGKVLGGYSMQRFWPLPLIGLWADVVAGTTEMLVEGLAMPDWWPLLGTAVHAGGDEKIVYLMIPLVAGLGYGDLALSRHPRTKRKETARNLAFYSVLLSIMAITAAFIPPMTLPAALLAPLGHEYLIKKSTGAEFSRPPLFSADQKAGLKILAVIPQSPAEKAGLQGGDRLLQVNDVHLYSEQDFWNTLRLSYSQFFLKIGRGDHKIDLRLQLYPHPISRFGVIFAPGERVNAYVEMKRGSLFKKLFKGIPGG